MTQMDLFQTQTPETQSSQQVIPVNRSLLQAKGVARKTLATSIRTSLELLHKKRPAWVVLENVYGHLSLGLDEVLNDLESKEYATRTFILPSGAIVGAPHKRDRLWIIGYSKHNGSSSTEVRSEHEENGRGASQGQSKTEQSKRASKRKCNVTMAHTRREHGTEGNATELDEKQTEWASRTVYAESSGERQSDLTNSECEGLEGGQRNDQRGERKTVSAEQHDRDEIRSAFGRSSRVSEQKNAAHTESSRWDCASQQKMDAKTNRRKPRRRFDNSSKDATDTNSQRGRGRQTRGQDAENVRQSPKHQRTDGERMETGQSESSLCGVDDGISTRLDRFDGWHREPEDIPRVAVGIKDRVNRLKGLGNAILPQIAQRIGEVIKVQHEKSR